MIIFKACRWKNFLSTGNSFTEIKLNRSKNTLIVGQNGAGKSTILDALTFGLFGKPFRKINKPQLPNSINTNDCLVEIEFDIGKKKYKVVRGIKPTIFEIYCDDVLLNQDAKSKDYQEHLEKNILKLNYKSFTQVVILGSASFIPFMQLTAADRRTIIEDLLDISIFSNMNSLLKGYISATKEEQNDLDYEIKLTVEKIKMQEQYLEEHKKNSELEISNRQNELDDNNVAIAELQAKIEDTQKIIDELRDEISDSASISNKSKKFVQIEAKFDDNLKKIKKEIQFFKDNDECPTCRQHIDAEHKDSHIKEKLNKKDEILSNVSKLKLEIEKVENRINQIADIQESIHEHNSQIVEFNTQVVHLNKRNTKVLQEIEKLKKDSENSEQNNTKLNDLRDKLNECEKKSQKLTEDKEYYDFAMTMLKDNGIKTRIIKQYLPVMNEMINKYLTSMEFFVNFNLDEKFEETIKSRHRDVFSYSSFSEGEKKRIDLALLFTWRQIAKMKNSVNTNLLLLDEVFDSSLDTVGTEEFMKIIGALDKNTNVFVISHKGDQLFDKFRSVIKFEKKNNFSGIAKT